MFGNSNVQNVKTKNLRNFPNLLSLGDIDIDNPFIMFYLAE